jgi:hypothetical protein
VATTTATTTMFFLGKFAFRFCRGLFHHQGFFNNVLGHGSDLFDLNGDFGHLDSGKDLVAQTAQAIAVRADASQLFKDALSLATTGDLEQAVFGEHGTDLRARLIRLHRFMQVIQDFLLIAGVVHGDKVDDDHATDVP